jgi:uncharacterized protein with HEPN domain
MRNDQATRIDIDMAARRVAEFVKGYSLERFRDDDKTWSAVLYQIGVIGEAVKRLSETFRAAHPSIPWTQIAAMRNRVIHGYDSVDLELVWRTATVSVPELQTALAGIDVPEADGN